MGRKKLKKDEVWCPMEGTDYEGFCVESFATISVKKRTCDHKEYCANLKQELDRKKQNENTTTA